MNQLLILRWITRIWSLASILFVLPFWNTGGTPTSAEAVGLLFFPVGVFVGFLIAWKYEGFGGLVSVLSLAAFHLWIYTKSGTVRIGPFFLLLSAPGFLFLICWWWSRGERHSANP